MLSITRQVVACQQGTVYCHNGSQNDAVRLSKRKCVSISLLTGDYCRSHGSRYWIVIDGPSDCFKRVAMHNNSLRTAMLAGRAMRRFSQAQTDFLRDSILHSTVAMCLHLARFFLKLVVARRTNSSAELMICVLELCS